MHRAEGRALAKKAMREVAAAEWRLAIRAPIEAFDEYTESTVELAPGQATLRERFDDRGVCNVAGFGAVGCRDVLKRIEILAPVFRHRAGVVEIGLVQLFDVGRIAPEQVRVRPVLLHHLAHLSHRFPAL